MRPRVTGWRPAMARRRVVLPAPLGPIRPRSVPPVSEKETSRTARSLPKRMRTSLSSTTGAEVGAGGALMESSGSPLFTAKAYPAGARKRRTIAGATPSAAFEEDEPRILHESSRMDFIRGHSWFELFVDYRFRRLREI